mgnify:CR=1 FL=1
MLQYFTYLHDILDFRLPQVIMYVQGTINVYTSQSGTAMLIVSTHYFLQYIVKL